jgi:hypothetical protein
LGGKSQQEDLLQQLNGYIGNGLNLYPQKLQASTGLISGIKPTRFTMIKITSLLTKEVLI